MKSTRTVSYKLGRKLICLYAQFLLKMDVFWQAHLPAGPKLIVANHPSTTDPFYLLTLFPQPLSILIIEHAFKAPLFGGILRLSGHIPVLSADRHSAFDAAHRQLCDGQSVAIFPEGDLSPRQGGSLPAHSGAARLALMTGAPVIPIGIYFQRERARALISKFNGQIRDRLLVPARSIWRDDWGTIAFRRRYPGPHACQINIQSHHGSH